MGEHDLWMSMTSSKSPYYLWKLYFAEGVEFVFQLLHLEEFGGSGVSRTLLVVYTGGILANALTPLLLHVMLVRQTQPTGIARWVRKALLFDAFFDSVYGALPIISLLLSFVYFYTSDESGVCRRAETMGISCGNARQYVLMEAASACAFGGRTPWATFIKLKSRIIPLILGPRRIVTAFKVQHWVAAKRDYILNAARNVVVAHFQHRKGLDQMREAFQLLRQNGDVSDELKTHNEQRIKRSDTWKRLKIQEQQMRDRVTKHLTRARSLRNFYVPVPRCALVVLTVTVAACCLYLLLRITTAGRCDKIGVDGGEAPCIVQTFVSE